jgi:plastocyanin
MSVAGLALALASCGGGGSPTSPSGGSGSGGAGGTGGGGTGGTTATITIGTDGRVTPSSVTVTPGSRVTFVNNHNRPHDMSSDPHPEHTDCPEINQVGFLQAGQSRATGNLNSVRRCGFHDHNEPSNAALAGTIVIQ